MAARIRASDKNLATAAFSADGRTLSAAGWGGLIPGLAGANF